MFILFEIKYTYNEYHKGIKQNLTFKTNLNWKPLLLSKTLKSNIKSHQEMNKWFIDYELNDSVLIAH